jgi:hypothetical protein
MTELPTKDVQKESMPKSRENGSRSTEGFFSRWGKLVFIAGIALLVVIAYIGVTVVSDQSGFPLDDSWIHQTYARNLAHSGKWEFVPGAVSAGSTAPLWTIFLSIGYVFGLPFLLWSSFLGWACLSWSAWAGIRLWGVLWPDRKKYDWVIGVVLVLSWPLVWSAGSSMETLLFIALSLELLFLYGLHFKGQGRSLVGLGFMSGLLILTRPEGLGLLILMAVGLFVAGETWPIRFKKIGLLFGGAIVPVVPYFAFNLWSSGSIWPNTFYAKQVEYASIYAQPLLSRFIRLLYLSLGGAVEGWRGISGAHLVLLPGVIVAGYHAARRDWKHKEFLQTLPLLWASGLVFVYAWRLPVTYQHGRYLFPAMPIWILYGLEGWFTIFDLLAERVGPKSRIQFMLSRIAVLTFATLLIVFLILGLQVFAQDVAFVNGEMVAVGQWLQENTPSQALVAAHDIGAIGYFAERPILDLAGLISPEIIPLLSDGDALLDYVQDSDSDYLVTAPGWTYDGLTSSENAVLMYSTGFDWTREQGVNNMAVYLLVK